MTIGRTRLAVIAALTLAGLGVALWAGIGRPEAAQGQSPEPVEGITVIGTGSVEAAPDRADFSFGVETQGTSPDDALAANSEVVGRVIDALKAAGVAAADIQTQQVSVSPRYGEDGQEIVGYTATNTVNATIKDLATVGAVIDAAVRAGANQVYGPTFSIGDQRALYSDALEKALEDARAKAQTIAAAAGVSLGRVTAIVESTSGGAIPLPAAAEEARADVPIEPGLQEIQAALTVTYEIS